MSLASLENQIVRELRTLTGNEKLTKAHIMEWRAGKNKVKPKDGEKLAYLELTGVSVAYKD